MKHETKKQFFKNNKKINETIYCYSIYNDNEIFSQG